MSPVVRPGPASIPTRQSLHKGWCPGALRPMAAADGLVVRLRITGGILRAADAHALADLALRHGNGRFDLTARANLQMRGVAESELRALVEALRRLGLVDDDPAAEAVRNVIASPMAGLHDGPDIRPIVAALEACLAGTPALHALPGKFGFLVDDGSAPSLAGVAADVRFDWTGDQFAVGLGTRGAAITLGSCAAADVAATADAVARGALALFARVPGAVRMRTLVEVLGERAVVDACRPRGDLPFTTPDRHGRDKPGHDDEGQHTTASPHSNAGDGRRPLGLAAPYGRLDAGQLRVAADVAVAARGELRLTPWRSLLVPGAGLAARERARSAGFIVDDRDPRRAIAACVGAPECARATTATREDADAFADLAAKLGDGIALHVSGCAKGCAHAGSAPATLIGRDGRYDLVLEGSAGDPPVRRDLDRDAVRAALAALLPA